MSMTRATNIARLIVALALSAAPWIVSAETVLITGANSGLGLEFTKQYAAKGWTVIATHRRRELPQTLADVVAKYPKVRVETLDVTSLDQAKALAAKLDGVPIDVLVNNAGVYNDRSGCAPGDDACAGSYETQKFGQLDFDLGLGPGIFERVVDQVAEDHFQVGGPRGHHCRLQAQLDAPVVEPVLLAGRPRDRS